MHNGDYDAAVEAYKSLVGRALDDETEARSLLGLGRAQLRNKAYLEAADRFSDLLNAHADSQYAPDATFLLGDALAAAGEPLSATHAYSSYLRLQASTVITPYVNLSLGDAFRAAGVYTAAIAPYEAAIAKPPSRAFEADARERLALAHTARQDYAAAVQQYDAILAMARQPAYRAQIEYQAAETLLLAGEVEAGYQRHTQVVETYPTEEPAYRSLVKLVQAGRPVNDFLRGQVDYYGGAYGPAVEALYRYIYAYPETHSGDAHWYAGLSYWEAGSLELAVNEFELLIDTHPESHRRGAAWLKLAELYADQGETDQALSTYRAFVDGAPAHPLAPQALWDAARLAERTGRGETAAATYLECQRLYPGSNVADDALFHGGLQLYRLGDLTEAADAWQTLADGYPEASSRPAALLWLGKIRLAEGEAETGRDALEAAVAAAPDQYYGLRAAELASDASLPSPPPDDAPQQDADSRAEAEAWLADWLGLASAEGSPQDLGKLSPRLAADGRLQRGRELWRLDRFQQAKAELEALRAETYSDALDQYQLARAYADLGLYRSSILCAWRVIHLSPVTETLDAPRFILELAYPIYYENLVLENAQRTGLDPLLIFSLIRQESLFESLATSSASAQGLMQVIPPTGAEIAGELGWPPDYATPDLYRPYVSLRFGTYYLAKQRDRFDGRIDAALAGYNGGPFNAQRWLERAGEDRDLFLETITFDETHLYVRRIQEHLAVYQALYGE
jgi:soluble lytic murein transglycosylase